MVLCLWLFVCFLIFVFSCVPVTESNYMSSCFYVKLVVVQMIFALLLLTPAYISYIYCVTGVIFTKVDIFTFELFVWYLICLCVSLHLFFIEWLVHVRLYIGVYVICRFHRLNSKKRVLCEWRNGGVRFRFCRLLVEFVYSSSLVCSRFFVFLVYIFMKSDLGKQFDLCFWQIDSSWKKSRMTGLRLTH